MTDTTLTPPYTVTTVVNAEGMATTTITTAGTPIIPDDEVEKPGPSAALHANPEVYVATDNRYMSPTGNDNNDGTESRPWRTFNKANASATPGMVITLANGVYEIGTTTLTNGGNKAAPDGYVVYRAATLGGAVVRATSSGHMFVLRASYLVFDGLEIDGNNNTCTLSGFESSTPSGGAGHHHWIINCKVHDCGQSGVQLNNSDYRYVIHNEVYNCSSVSGYFGSGISIYNPELLASYTPTAMDREQPNICIDWNISHDNCNPQTGANSDGNGIIIDDWRHTQNAPNVSYKAGGRCTWNLTYRNGGKGIQCFFTENVVIEHNTEYGSNWDLNNKATWRGGIAVQQSGGITVRNNISVAVSVSTNVTKDNSGYLGQQRTSPNTWTNNISFGGRSNQFGNGDSFPVPPNKLADPLFTNAASGDFTLASGSPAIGFGTDGKNAGAYQ